MRIHKLALICLCGSLLLLSGCSHDDGDKNIENLVETQALEKGDYGASLPFKSSDSRQQHNLRARSLVDSMYIGTGLLQYSKEYFSTSNYTIQEGQFLGYDELRSLLGRTSDANPDGMNPASGSSFDTGNGAVTAPVIVRDIYEVDFMKGSDLHGISLAVVFNGSVSENGTGETTTTITDDKLQAFAEDAVRRLITDFMRKQPEIGDSIPIYVALYKDSSKDDTLPGAYFSEAYFEGRTGNFSSIDEKWVMFPSTEATKLDGTTATQFAQMKNSLYGYLPDDVNIIARGKFESSSLKELHIDIEMYAKTATEAISLTQYVKTLLSTFTSQDYKIVVEVSCQNKTIATMQRLSGKSDVQTISLI